MQLDENKGYWLLLSFQSHFSNQCQLISIPPGIIPIWWHEKNPYQETRGKSLLISSLTASRQKPVAYADMLQCVKQWRPKRTLSTAEKWHPDILINGAYFELCSNCCILRSSRYSVFGSIPSKTCVIAAGCGAWVLIRWPCGPTITQALSCLSRPVSGSSVIERQ